MKIPANASYELVYSITVHPHLGALIEAYVVQLTSAGNLSLVNQRIHSNNADYYDKKLDDDDYKALELLDECSPEFIVRKFSKVKRIRPSEFFARHFDQTQFKRQIRPHIEKKLGQVLGLIQGKKLYVKKLKNVVYEPIEWCKEPATVLFHLRRNDNNTHYFATIKHDNHRVPYAQNHSILLSTSPCYLVAGGKLLYFDSRFDGNKIRPFIHKRFVEISRQAEEGYFKNFVVPLIEENNVYAVGLDIVSEKYVAKPIIRLGVLLNGEYGLTLHFDYGPYRFPYHSSKYVSVQMEKEEDSYRFIRVKRSKQWEEIKKQSLEMLGVQHRSGSEFGFSVELGLEDLIEWASEQQESLQKAGFEVVQTFDEEYSLVPPQLELVAEQSGDWFDVKAKVILGGFQIPIQDLRKAIRNGQTSYTLPNGQVAIIPKRWVEQIQGLSLFTQDEGAIKLRKQHVGIVKPFLSKQADEQVSIADFEGIVSQPMPDHFIGELRPYQKAGYDWLCFLNDTGFGGCLADDMGLGKTVQSLAFLQRNLEMRESGQVQVNLFDHANTGKPSLLVVPTSLVFNWVQEAQKFTPKMVLYSHVGVSRTKDVVVFNQADLIITTYGTLRNDIELLKSVEFDVVLLDESQFIKNPTSKLAKTANQLQSRLRLTLTGTPIENTVVDLWSQMNFVNPGLLGNYKFFQKEFAIAIEKKQDRSRAEQLQQLIKPFVMRRTKMQVAGDLPPKTEQVIYCDMTDEQQDLYEKTKSTYRNMIIDSVQKNGLAKSRIQLLAGLTKLRQIANHPLLNDAEYEASSGKFQQIEYMLMTALEENHRVLIFSQFVGHLKIVRELLERQGIEYGYIDGSVKASDRKKEVEAFQNNEKNVFLISLKAGGYGLNLTAADYVFLLDPWWNPAAENQAIDRTHRIGQTQNVFSYKFITRNTVEDKIVALQNKKKKLSDSLIQTEESYIKQVTQEDIQHLFG